MLSGISKSSRSNFEFRIMDQEEIARLWGQTKNNPNMTYENFR